LHLAGWTQAVASSWGSQA